MKRRVNVCKKCRRRRPSKFLKVCPECHEAELKAEKEKLEYQSKQLAEESRMVKEAVTELLVEAAEMLIAEQNES